MSTLQTASGRWRLPDGVTTLFAVVTAVSFSASSSAPTPLYHLYQRSMGLSNLTVTMIFASYALTMVATFLTVARLSDYVGRRPMILSGLVLNGLALGLFLFAHTAFELVAARLAQGVAVSIGMTTLGATILDTDRENGPVYNSVTAFFGLTAGSLLSGILVEWAPVPMRLVFLVLLAVTAVEILVLPFAPETSSAKPGGLKVLLPQVSVPPAALPTLVRLLPLNVAAWSLGGFYLSLMPTLVAAATGVKSALVGALVVAALMFTGASTVLVLRRAAPGRLLNLASFGLAAGIAVTLVGVRFQSALVMVLGTVIAGTGFGSSYGGNLRSILPLAREHERAGLLAAYFVESYISFAIPTILAGLAVPLVGLVETSEVYGASLIGLAILSAVLRAARRPAPASACA